MLAEKILPTRFGYLNWRHVLRSAGLVLATAVLLLRTGSMAIAADAQTTGTAAQGILSQLPPGMTPEQAADLIKQNQAAATAASANGQVNPPGPNNNPQRQFYVNSGAANTEKPSDLEKLYTARTGIALLQFGYDLVGNGGTPLLTDNEGDVRTLGNVGSVSGLQVGAVQDNYILGPGDSLTVTLRGQDNATYEIPVSRDGTITLPSIAPISAAGRSFGDVRADLERAVAGAFIQTKVYVTVSQIRQLSVRVVGEVQNPGVYAVTGLSTVLDAINLAGGIKKTGSLRSITVVRDGRSYNIDLYSMLLTHGTTPDMSVAQGDRIVIPAIGHTVAVVGNVRRPGIYELPPGADSIGAPELLALANGAEVPGVYREMIQQIRSDGKRELRTINAGSNEPVRDGEILYFERAVEETIGSVRLEGAVVLPGVFSLDQAKTLRDLLSSVSVLAERPYLLLGFIDRVDPQTRQRVVLPFSPLRVLQGKENQNLISQDTVHILTLDGMRELAESFLQEDQRDGACNQTTPAKAFDQNVNGNTAPKPISVYTPEISPIAVSSSGATTAGNNNCASEQTPVSTNSGVSATSMSGITNSSVGPTSTPGMTNSSVSATSTSDMGFSSADAFYFGQTLGDLRVNLTGAVHQPGVFLIAPGTTLDELVLAAGGLTQDVDLNQFELTSSTINNTTGKSDTVRMQYPASPTQFSQITLKPFDQIVFRHVYTDIEGGTVKISGEVRYPGVYNIIRGERLSSLIARAGGFTQVAYPIGAVFTRLSVAESEQEAYEYEASEIESGLTSAALNGSGSALSVTSYYAPFSSGQNSDSLSSTVSGAKASSTNSYIEDILQQLRSLKALGRISIIADPTILATRPDEDVVLEPGDSLTIPRRPASVNVVGEVRSPVSVLFNSAYSVDDYIRLSGGATRLAESDDIFIVSPDGTAHPVSDGFLNFDQNYLAPGSTIVVPRDVTPPFMWLDGTTKILNIISQLAITAASLDILSRP